MANKQLIDLSAEIEQNEGEIAPYKIKQIWHTKGADSFGRHLAFSKKETLWKRATSIANFLLGKKIDHSVFPQQEFLNIDIVTASTHTGTHMDSPLHFGSTSEGQKAIPIDEIPIEWCFGDGVLLDLSHKNPGDFILESDIKQALKVINYKLKPLDIVLIKTGSDKYWGTKEYLFKYCGMSKEATGFLIDRGIKVIGIDTYSFDRPFKNMIDDYFKTKDNAYLWPAHFYGREKTYCHIERLVNLDTIPKPFGFQVACLPIKVKSAGASWVRAIAII